ncbi:MAG: 5'-3' exonuclease H3TH domain-containing protein [bacterium]
MPKIHLIDASPYIFRAYYSIPTSMQAPDGMVVNAIFGYTNFLIQLLNKAEPTHIAVAFDGSLTTSFRNEIYPEYKAQRDAPPDDLKAQFEHCFEVTQAMGMPAFIDDRYEADDIIGTLVKQFGNAKNQVVVLSNDKDLAQLVNERVWFWDFAKDKMYDPALVKNHFGVRPQQIIDLLALMGDSVDNIPGVAGIGHKTATALLREFDCLEGIFAELEAVANLPMRGAKSVQAKLTAGKDMAQLSKQLATIASDVPVSVNLDAMYYQGANPFLIRPLFEQLGFGKIQERIPKWQDG